MKPSPSLGCDFASLHTNTQICIRRFSIVRRFFHLHNRLLCFFCQKTGFVGEYTNTHYKMTRFLFEHPWKFIHRTYKCSAWNIHLCNKYTYYALARGTFLRCLRKVPQAHSWSACVLQELGWKYMQTISNFVWIFLLNPNFLLAHRNRYLEGMDDGQKTPRGNPDFNSYVKILRVFIFQTDGQTDRRQN